MLHQHHGPVSLAISLLLLQAYLAITCGSATDGNVLASGTLNTAAVNLAGVWLSASLSQAFQLTFRKASPDWTATIDASNLQAGRHYRLCTDLDGSTGTMPMGANDFEWYVTGVAGLPHYKFGLKQQTGPFKKVF